jgi:hypothetical protein
MSIIHPTSLSLTLDCAAEACFLKKAITPATRKQLIALLTSRQILSGSNSGFFISFTSETWIKLRLFTGETLQTEFACQHLNLIEAARLLVLLAEDHITANRSIQLAHQRMSAMCYARFCPKGECRPLSIAYMRYLATVTTEEAVTQLQSLLTKLASFRDGKGKWHGFPLFYTLLMLTEVSGPLAARELDYASQYVSKHPPRHIPQSPYAERRQTLLNTIQSRSVKNANPMLLGQYR